MNINLSLNTKAILLLTAPLGGGARAMNQGPLTPGEYRQLARFLHEMGLEPAQLLGKEADKIYEACCVLPFGGRLEPLLSRGFLLSQAVERWHARAIWIISRADPEYPKLLKTRLRDASPPVLYGCGDISLLEKGGLAVVGSRHVDSEVVAYAEQVGHNAARAEKTIVSGGARGVDQAAMRGALEAGGRVIGIMADSLERACMNRDNRAPLMDGQLLLISPYDPGAGFNVGNAMQRNKLIYALSDAALVVSVDYQKGGTWAGAVEQLDKMKLVPVYVRADNTPNKGVEALIRKGALKWPGPNTPEEFVAALRVGLPQPVYGRDQLQLSLLTAREATEEYTAVEKHRDTQASHQANKTGAQLPPAETLFITVRTLLARMDAPKTESEVAAYLDISRNQARIWLRRLTDEGILRTEGKRPIRYQPR